MFGWRRLTEKHREDAELSLHCFASSRGLMRSAPMGRRSEHTCSRRSKRGKGGHNPCFCRLRPLGFCMECWAAPVATVVVSCSCSRWWNTGGPPVEQQLQDLLLGCPWPATSRSQHQIWPLGRHPHLLIYRQGSPEPPLELSKVRKSPFALRPLTEVRRLQLAVPPTTTDMVCGYSPPKRLQMKAEPTFCRNNGASSGNTDLSIEDIESCHRAISDPRPLRT